MPCEVGGLQNCTYRVPISHCEPQNPRVSRSCESEYHWLKWSSLRLQGSTQRYPFSFSKLQRGEPRGTIRTWKEVERVLETANTPNKHYSVRDEIAAGGFLNKLRGIQRPLTVAKEVLAIANTPKYKCYTRYVGNGWNIRWFCPDLKTQLGFFHLVRFVSILNTCRLNKIVGPKPRWHSSCNVGSAGSSSAILAQSSDM